VEYRAFAADELDAIESDLGRVVETVNDDNVITGFEEGKRRE
jgi:hypothetical protein